MKLLLAMITLSMSFSVFALGYKVKCESYSIAGDNVAKTIENCVEFTSRDKKQCARSVSCNTYKTHCESSSIAGDTIAKTIENCVIYANRTKKQCARSVKCM
jgi:hypothetical protein